MFSILLLSLETEQERKKMTEIYDEHKNTLFYVAYGITKKHQLAEDVVHNVFEKLIKKNKEDMFSLTFDEFRRRYVIITKNEAIDLMRREKIYADLPSDDFETAWESDDLPIDIQVINQEEYDALRRYISSLDEQSKTILEMKYVLGMSYKEIGEATNLTPKHVDTKIMRAKAKIRKKMLEEEIHHAE